MGNQHSRDSYAHGHKGFVRLRGSRGLCVAAVSRWG